MRGAWRAVAQVVDPDHAPPRAAEPATSPEPEAPDTPSSAVEVGPDQMLVPIDAWSRILEQVGNLHEAGQELADARERAAKAETENTFLREQLRTLKDERGARRRPAAPREPKAEPPPAEPPPERRSAAAATDRGERASARLRQVRTVAGRWISPN